MTEDVQAELGFPIVGIGASAGGLEALRDFVRAVKPRSGIAYVIVQHLAADHPSIMDKLLASHSELDVLKIEDGMTVEPDTIYVIPAGPSVTVEDGRLHLHERSVEKGVRTPIDEFLQSLAEDRGRTAFAVILSGTGSDGTLGVRAIKTAGGIAMVQKSDSARFSGMPDSAAATGLVDFVLKPEAMPERLLEIVKYRDELENGGNQERVRQDIKSSLQDILGVIDSQNGQDFSEYKSGTLMRRIERRMTLLRERSVASFIERIQSDGEERDRLLQDFLIGVTRFFRDEDAFEILRQDAILPMLNSDQTRFRVWVPGCSTGEEVYTIAMLVNEAMEASNDQRPCQIFGTDIDTAALSFARNAIYTKSQLEGISPERRERFFTKTEDRYQVNAKLREHCVFAPHNLLQDPPFSRLDLISCRNLLIYLSAKVQSRIIPRFHYALNSEGFLFLGPSESLGKEDRFFSVIDRDNRLFKRNDAQPTGYSSLTAANRDTFRREKRFLQNTEHQLRAAPPRPDLEQQITSFFLRECAAPFAMINAQDEVSYLSERMGQYVAPSMGQPSSALDQFLVKELRLPVRTAISKARSEHQTVITQNVIIRRDDKSELIDIEAKPMPFAEGAVMVTLNTVRSQDSAALVENADERRQAEREFVERELVLTRQQLAATLSDYEGTEQELRSTNEELLSMNEELQSSNEELETSREELQSINEELETINAELSENNRQLVQSNSDLKNLFESTDIATVFLDQTHCVRRYTPAARRLFAIQDRDIGRPLSDLKWKVTYDTFEEDIAKVVRSLEPIEQEVKIAATDETFLMRIRPYRRMDDRIDGCVMSLVDISQRKKDEKQLLRNADVLRRQYAELETLYDTTPVGLNLLDSDFRYMRINRRLAEINGFSIEEHIGKRQDEVIPEIDALIRKYQQNVFDTGEPVKGLAVRGLTPGALAEERDWVVDFYPVRKDGAVFAVGSAVQDVTEQKHLQRDLQRSLDSLSESESRLEFALETGELGAWELDVATGNSDERTDLHDKVFGYHKPLDDWSLDIFMDHVCDDDKTRVRQYFDVAIAEQENWQFECRIHRSDGQTRWIEAHGRPVVDATTGKVSRFLGTVQDITERKKGQEQQNLLLQELQHRVKNTLATTQAIVQFSARRATDVGTFVSTLRARLHSIARTHDLLTARNWGSTTLKNIIDLELEPYIGESSKRVLFTGDDIELDPGTILSLSLAFHELTTNAVKYGALSNDVGRVSIRSRKDSDGMCHITWEEEKGPPIAEKPDRKEGFGSFLLEKVLASDLGGRATVELAPEGIKCSIEFPANTS